MRGLAVYFSGTGNTEYVMKSLKESFNKKDISLKLYPIEKTNYIKDDYDFYVFAGPIYAEFFPSILTNFIKEKIPNVKRKKAIIISTQAGDYTPTGINQLSDILKSKGFNIVIEYPVYMANNYYVVAFKKPTNDDIENAKINAKEKSEYIVNTFINNKIERKKVNILKRKLMYLIYKFADKYFKKFAQKKFTIDLEKCVSCNICINECPTKNIYKEDNNIYFKDKCQSCMRCIHICPVNAFRYKNKKIDQYKIIKKHEIRN